MQYFWNTTQTIAPGLGFSRFGWIHLTWLSILGMVWLGVCLAYRGLSKRWQRRVLKGIACAMIAGEIFRMAVLFGTDQFHWKYLPLDLCGVSMVVCLMHAFRPNDDRAEFLYAVTRPLAILILLIPGWNELPARNFFHIYGFVSHGLMGLYAMLVLNNGFQADYRRLGKVAATLLCVAPPIYLMNRFGSVGFFFLLDASEVDVFRGVAEKIGEGWCIVLYMAGLLILWTLMYAPSRRRIALEEQT